MEGTIIFITGGARSGKSSYAEQLAMKLSGRLRYIATARRSDAEMVKRIKRHEKMRHTYEERWETIESPLLEDLACETFSAGDVVLFDCLTVFMANELYHSRRQVTTLRAEKELQDRIHKAFLTIAKQVKTLLVVSNELFYELQQENNIVAQYERTLGQLHERIVHDASIALLIEAGEPIIMKGAELFNRKFVD